MNDFHKDCISVIVQARMKSTRLPGKTLKKVLGKPLLLYLIERLKRADSINQIIVATTKDSADDCIKDVCTEVDIPIYRGDEQDVLSRYLDAAKYYQTNIIVRITADCPLVDPEIIDHAVGLFLLKYPDVSYVSNTLDRTYPRGYDVEVFSTDVLSTISKEKLTQSDKEHVTKYIYNHPELFKLENFCRENNVSKYRLTVDTQEDFEVIQRILESLYPENPNFNLEDVLQLLQKYPNWAKLNAHINQKKF